MTDKQEAWVLVDPDGQPMWETAGPSRGACKRKWNNLSVKLNKFYTFSRVEAIPDGCRVCESFDLGHGKKHWEPV